MKFTFKQKEKLKGEKLVAQLFAEGQSIAVYPLRLVYLQKEFADGTKIKVGVSVSKRNFKKAVDRNRIKRSMREVYRLQKDNYFNNFYGSYALFILYIGKESADFHLLNQKMTQLFDKFLQKTS